MDSNLDAVIAGIERRYGSRALRRGDQENARRTGDRFPTRTSFDLITEGGIAPGGVLLFAGTGTTGKLTFALRVIAAGQRGGGDALWLDPSASFDAGAAERAGVDLDRLVIVRPRDRESALFATAAGLRGNGFRVVVVDTGPAIVPATIVVDHLAPLVPLTRSSTAALVVVSDRKPERLALPQITFERIGWERRFARTSGWTFAVSRRRGGGALFRADAFGHVFTDLGARDAREREVAV